MAAGRAWAKGTLSEEPHIERQEDDAFSDAKRFGIDETIIVTMLDQQNHNRDISDQAFNGVWPDNVKAVTAFVAGCSQWRTVSTPGGVLFVGLDYASARVAWKAFRIKIKKDLFTRLQVIEFAAAKAMNGGRS